MIKQFVKFGLVGAINSILNYLIYAICIKWGVHYIVANIIGYIIVIFNAYLLQNRFVFNKKDRKCQQSWWKILLKTYLSYAFTGLLLTNLLSWLWIDFLDLTVIFYPIYNLTNCLFGWKSVEDFVKYVAPFLNTIITIPINFVINKFWTYR